MSSDLEHQYLPAEAAEKIIKIIEGAQNGQKFLPEREEAVRRFISTAMRHHAHERDNTISNIAGNWTYLQYTQVCILLDAGVGVRDSLGIFDYINSNPALINRKKGEKRGASTLDSELFGHYCHRIQYGGAVSGKFYEMDVWLARFSDADKEACLYQYNEWKKMPESETIWKREDMQMENWCPTMDWDTTAKRWFESKRRVVPQKVQARSIPNDMKSGDSYAEGLNPSVCEPETPKPKKKSHKKETSAEMRTMPQIEYPGQGNGSYGHDEPTQYRERTTGRELQTRRAPTPEPSGYPTGPQSMMVQRSGASGQAMQPLQRPQSLPNGHMTGAQDMVLQKSIVNERGQVFQVWEPEHQQPMMSESMMLSQGRVQELDERVQDLELYQQPQARMSDGALVPQGYEYPSGEKKKGSKGLIRFKH